MRSNRYREHKHADTLGRVSDELDVTDDHEEVVEEAEFERFKGDEAIQMNFDSSQCLFCNQIGISFAENLVHMQRYHGFIISDKEKLVVDVETFLSYLHLIIAGYNECLFCNTLRNGAQAVQQHMAGKSHCKYDISNEQFGFLDFYNLTAGTEGDDETSQKEKLSKLFEIARPHDSHLPDGKHRKPLRSRLKPQLTSFDPYPKGCRTEPELDDCELSKRSERSSSNALATRAEKREISFATQLTHLRAEDRRALMHLPVPQQRALLVRNKKQVENAGRVERDLQSRTERKGNKIQYHARKPRYLANFHQDRLFLNLV